MTAANPFYLQKDNLFVVPILHYNMETAAEVCKVFKLIKPSCVAVELPETMQLQLLHAASRLPDLSVVTSFKNNKAPLHYLAEPCDASFEGLRLALEHQLPAHCIDLAVDDYPNFNEFMPDPYAIQRIGLKEYYSLYRKSTEDNKLPITSLDEDRELYMARRLKELCLSHDSVLFVGGMFHVERILHLTEQMVFPKIKEAKANLVEIATLTEESARDILMEWGWVSNHYEEARQDFFENKLNPFPPDRQKLIFQLLKKASLDYQKETGNPFASYHLRNTMKFARNYALTKGRLLPNLFQLLAAAKGCVEHNYAYEVWKLASDYSHLKNIDNLNPLPLTIEEIWGKSKKILFHLKQQSRKSFFSNFKRKDKSHIRRYPPTAFSICSYPPEDAKIEKFGNFLKKKGTQVLIEEGSKTIPFSCSIEDGIDTRETIRHWSEKKLFVKVQAKPKGTVGSVVVIFDEDSPGETDSYKEKYTWHTTWIGEHNQESDMAFYATHMHQNVVGPGISRCEYGGFMMSYPPRRLFDVWSDPDYAECRNKAEVLLMAAIDYAQKPLITYVAAKPPRSLIKSFARRFGKKIIYVPIGQLSPITLNKLRTFHVLDGHDKREIAGDYIY